jgi:large conductance mechanosensitive channel
MNKQAKGFLDFIREAGVVGLAIGLAIGTQVTIVVGQVVDNFINPLVGFLLSFILKSGSSLQDYTWTITTGSHPLAIGWGAIVSSLIKFAAVAAVIYYVVKGLRLDKLDKEKK